MVAVPDLDLELRDLLAVPFAAPADLDLLEDDLPFAKDAFLVPADDFFADDEALPDERDDDPLPEAFDRDAPLFEVVERDDDALFAPVERDDDALFGADERDEDDPLFEVDERDDEPPLFVLPPDRDDVDFDLPDVEPPLRDDPLLDERDDDELLDEPDLLPPLFPDDEVLVGINILPQCF